MLKSRVIAFLLVVTMLVSCVGMAVVPAAASDAPTVTIGSATGKPGETVQLTVTLENNPGIGGIIMFIKHPDEIEMEPVYVEDYGDGTYFYETVEDLGLFTPARYVDYTESTTPDVNPFCVMWLHSGSPRAFTNSGEVCILHYTIPEGTPAGEYEIAFTFEEVPNDKGVLIKTSAYEWQSRTDTSPIETLDEFVWVNGVITVEAEEEEPQPTECAHEWSEWEWDEDDLPTCGDAGQENRTCSKCGETESQSVPALGHDWQGLTEEIPADCENEGTIAYEACGRCGQLRDENGEEITADDLTIPALGHDLGEYVSNGDATCETDGTKTAACSRCDYTETVTDEGSKEDAPHSFQSPVSNGDATCTADGTWTYTCEVCGETKVETEPGSALGHSYGEWYEYKAPTLEADGEERRDCKRCDAYESNVIPALQHEYTAVYTDPTCTEDGYTTYTCSKSECPHSYVVTDEGSALGHDHHSVGFIAPTCTSDGTDYYACERCGDSYRVPVPALGHELGEYVSNGDATCEEDGTKTAKCVRCDHTDTVADEGSALGHELGEYVSNNDAGCETDGTKTAKCVRCDHTETVADEGSALGHDMSGWATVLAPECGVPGLKENQCSRCDYLESESIPALEHSFTEYVSDNNATCEEDGTKTASCDHDCGETHTVTDEGSALGHSYGDWYVYKAATLESEGEERRDCVRCDAYESKVIPALTHEYTSVYTEPTCTSDGYTTYTCSKEECPHTYVVTDEGSALGHDMGEWVETKAPSCGVAGEETRECSRCDHSENREVAALEHSYTVENVTKEPTCTEKGEKTFTCTNCGEFITEEIAALGHDMGEYVSNNDATCEADGTKTAECSRCDHTDTVADEGSALGHDMGEWVETKAPSCGVAGEETRECSRCDHSENREVAALEHSYTVENVTKEPTCTEKGEKTFTCERCGEFITEEIAALGHDMGQWIVTKEATCEEDGSQQSVCSRCDETVTEVIPAIGHSYEVVTVEPTCEAAGSETSTCANCGDVIVEELPALGHSFTEYTSNGDADCENDGTKTAACDRCDATHTTVDEGSALGHEIVEHEAVPATCRAEGSIAYTECSRCGKLWNGEGTEITLADTVIAKLAEMDGTTAVVNPETVQTQADGSTVIDLTNAGTQVDKVIVPADAIADAEGPVIISAPNAAVYIPAESVAANQGDIELSLGTVAKEDLTDAQKTALDNVIFVEGVSIQTNVPVTEGSQVAITFELPAGHKASDIEVWAVTDGGEVTKLEAEQPDGYLVFDAVEGGEYLIISTRTDGSPAMGDNTNLIILIVALLASLAGMVVAIINRKKSSR